MRSFGRAKLLKAVVCSVNNPPQPDDGQRHEYYVFCRAEKVRKVTEAGWDYFEWGECAGVRYVIEMHRGELEDR